MRTSHLEKLMLARRDRRALAQVTFLASGRQVLLKHGERADPLLGLDEALDHAFERDQSVVVDTVEGSAFINVFNPALRMVIIGAVHIAQALVGLAKQAGYDVIVIDPRTAFATPERLPGATVHAQWPDEILPQIGLDPRTAFVALAHDPKIDDPALHLALASNVFYVGALGSKRTHEQRRARFLENGTEPSLLRRMHAPIGLDIGAKGPVEIALSIMAEVTAARHGKLPTLE
ncbi:MAG: XdhC family protein [Hyphomicrobiaceae bacterium]